jgi:CRP/FNR family cyclic AMP-dependent transcriptional regulator
LAAAPKKSANETTADQTLASVELFAVAAAPMRKRYEAQCAWRWWNKGAQIVGRDDLSDDVYFVIRGKVRIVNYVPSGSGEIAFDEVGEGGYFGEMAAIDQAPRSATLLAETRTLTARLGGAAFRAYLAEEPKAALLMMQHLTEIVRTSNQRIMDLSTLAAQNRIYADLLRQARTGGKLAANTAAIEPVPRHHAIAARASTARETVARAIADLTRRGLLKRDGKALVITDVAALTGMVSQFRA